MATRYSTRTFCKTQSPTSSYKRNNRLVTEGYDLETATYWFRIDFGAVREFKSRAAMEAALEAEFAPIVRVPDLPQLPAYIPPVLPRDWPEVRTARRRAWAQLRSTRGTTLPTHGVIYLPAPRPADLAAEVQAAVTAKKAWSAGETVWIADRAAFIKEDGGFLSLYYLPPRRGKFTPPVQAGRVGFFGLGDGWKLGRDWRDLALKAERGLGAAS